MKAINLLREFLGRRNSRANEMHMKLHQSAIFNALLFSSGDEIIYTLTEIISQS